MSYVGEDEGEIRLGMEGEKKKTSWVKWDAVLNFKEKCGLGVGSISTLNRALLI